MTIKVGMAFALVTIVPTRLSNGIFWLVLMSLASEGRGTENFKYFQELEPLQPYCEVPVDIDIGADYFTEISNPVPGLDAYNELVRYYKQQQWESLAASGAAFEANFERSPLRDPAVFLQVQAKYDRLRKDNTEADRSAADAALREATLVSPHSQFIPVVNINAAAFWLREVRPEKALALLETVRRNNQNTEYDCISRTGIAEANFLMHDWAVAKPHFESILKDCQNPRLRFMAHMRLADFLWLDENPQGAERAYEKILDDDIPGLQRYFPSVSYNLGELKYRKKDYPRARYYFSQYMHKVDKEGRCDPATRRRMADIALQTNRPWREVAGLYFEAHEVAPLTDIGRFSYIQGLLIGLANFKPAEIKRRSRIVDEELGHISDDNLRNIAFLEKGLALLDAGGESQALDYLTRFQQKTQGRMDHGSIGIFIRQRLMATLEEQVASAIAGEEDKSRDGKILQAIEGAYPVWFSGKKGANRVRDLYSRLILHIFESALADDDLTRGLAALSRWKASTLWQPDSPDTQSRTRVASSLARGLISEDGEISEENAVDYLKREEDLKPFVGKNFPWLWSAVALAAGDDERLKKEMTRPKGRGLASISSTLPKKLAPRFWLVDAEAQLKLGKFTEAETSLQKVTDPALKVAALGLKASVYEKTKQYAKAFDVQWQLLDKKDPEERKATFHSLYDLSVLGKLWKKGPTLLSLAEKDGLAGKDLAPFHFLAGRASLEKSRWQDAVQNFETVLQLDSSFERAAEVRFRLGKSLMALHRPTEARKIWEELAAMKDSFWSPLAQNEIKTLK